MKTFLLLFLAMATGAVALQSTAALGEDMTTLGGETYKGVSVTAVSQYEVTFSYGDGIATVPLASLPDAAVAQLSPGFDWAKDGRFWFERAQVLYDAWQKHGRASGQKIADVMAPVREHLDVVAEYAEAVKLAQWAATLAKSGEKKKAGAPTPLEIDPVTGHRLMRGGDVWRQLNDPGIIERFLHPDGP